MASHLPKSVRTGLAEGEELGSNILHLCEFRLGTTASPVGCSYESDDRPVSKRLCPLAGVPSVEGGALRRRLGQVRHLQVRLKRPCAMGADPRFVFLEGGPAELKENAFAPGASFLRRVAAEYVQFLLRLFEGSERLPIAM